LLDRSRSIEDRHVGNTEAGRCHVNAQLRSNTHIPVVCMLAEPETDGFLPRGMIVLSHGPFLDGSVHILCIGLIAGPKVDLDRNMGSSRHGDPQFKPGCADTLKQGRAESRYIFMELYKVY
jgi:hypothetical protein